MRISLRTVTQIMHDLLSFTDESSTRCIGRSRDGRLVLEINHDGSGIINLRFAIDLEELDPQSSRMWRDLSFVAILLRAMFPGDACVMWIHYTVPASILPPGEAATSCFQCSNHTLEANLIRQDGIPDRLVLHLRES